MANVMIHLPEGEIVEVEYWHFREILREASKALFDSGNPDHANTCERVARHLVRTDLKR